LDRTTAEDSLAPSADSPGDLGYHDEEAIANTVRNLERRIAETVDARQKAENRARLCAESEARVRGQVAVRRRGEEELLRQAEEEATQRRAEEERLVSEHAARVRVEEEATNFAEEETRLKLEASRLRQAAAELAKRRSAIDDAARVAQLAEAKRRRREAEEQHTAEMDRLRSEEESLRHTTGRALQRRREVDVARQEIAVLLQRLDEEKSQLTAAATIARDTEAERIREQ